MIPCLVLNASLDPLAVVSAERGLILVMEGKARIEESHPTRKFHSVRQEFPIPTTIVLKAYQSTGSRYHGPAQLNQRNLFVRDNYLCAYCSRHVMELNYDETLGEVEYLTRDHVKPLSKGGTDSWDNVVTACSTCNHSKDNHEPEEILEFLLAAETRLVRLKAELEEGMSDPHDRIEELRSEYERVAKEVALWQGLLRPVYPRPATVFEILQKRQRRLNQEKAA